MLDATTFQDEKVIKHSEQFVPVKIDTDKNKPTREKFRIFALPTILFVDEEGRKVKTIRGYRPADVFAKTMEEVARIHRELPQLEARFSEEPQDLETGATLATVYAFRGEATKAKRCIKTVEKTDPDNEKGHLTEPYLALAELYENSGDLRKAGKFYEKAAESGTDVMAVADARFNAASAFFKDRERFDPGSRARIRRLEDADEQLESLLAMNDLSPEQRGPAKELLQSVEAALQECQEARRSRKQ